MKVCVDKSVCIGCGMCAEVEPSVFQMDEDGLASSVAEEVSDAKENVRQAIEACPVGAISEE